VGAEQEVRVDVRVLSATHRNLAAEVEEGRFRSDLFYRINVIELQVPSLRDRSSDIPLLAKACVRRLAAEYGTEAPRIEETSLAALMDYEFPGNVRELENILERAFTLCENGTIRVEDLRLLSTGDREQNVFDGISDDAVPDARVSLETFLEDVERKALLRTLELERWNRTAAARRLGISFRQMRYRLKKLGID